MKPATTHKSTNAFTSIYDKLSKRLQTLNESRHYERIGTVRSRQYHFFSDRLKLRQQISSLNTERIVHISKGDPTLPHKKMEHTDEALAVELVFYIAEIYLFLGEHDTGYNHSELRHCFRLTLCEHFNIKGCPENPNQFEFSALIGIGTIKTIDEKLATAINRLKEKHATSIQELRDDLGISFACNETRGRFASATLFKMHSKNKSRSSDAELEIDRSIKPISTRLLNGVLGA